MGSLTPITVRRSTLGQLAALLLVVLIVSPFTAPFSVMSGELTASPSGPADSVGSETTQTVHALVELIVVHVEPFWTAVSFHAPAPMAIVEIARVSRVLRL